MRKLIAAAALMAAVPAQAATVQYATLVVTDTAYSWVAPGASMEEIAIGNLTSRLGCKGAMLVDFLNCVGKSKWTLVTVTSYNPPGVRYPMNTFIFMRPQ